MKTDRRGIQFPFLLAGFAALLVSFVPMAAPASAQQSVAVEPGSVMEFGTMWTFDAPPISYWEGRYGFDVTQEWLDDLRLSSIRLPGCSSSFVSEDGLVMTNHHCARSCIAAVSSDAMDYMAEGFVASTRDDEPLCPGLYVDQLVDIEDVTHLVREAVTALDAAGQVEQRDAAVADIRERCEASTGNRCQVVPFYNGGMYSLYQYRRFDDVRLVMAPELQAAYFGGDWDNFTYPRFDLDMTFLRVYENGRPYHPEHYLRWSEAGAVEDEAVFVVGNPGSTGRLNTLAQMEYLRDVTYPARLAGYDRQLDVLYEYTSHHPEQLRTYQNTIFGIENSKKATAGYLSGLLDEEIMSRKSSFEDDFRARIQGDPALDALYGSAWDEIAGAQIEMATIDAQNRYYGFAGSTLLGRAMSLVTLARQMAIPEADRPEGMTAEVLDRARAQLLRDAPIDTYLDGKQLAAWLESAVAELGRQDPLVRALVGDRSPADAAAWLMDATLMGDASERARLLDAGEAAMSECGDPMVLAALELQALGAGYANRMRALNDVVSANTERLGRAIYEAYGTAIPPDATFTLRISDGVVKGFPYNGTIAPYKTTFYGLFARSAEFDGQPPFDLTPRWRAAESRLDLSAPVNFVSTADIIGGNSGSPVVNAAGEVVGLVFDGNIEMLPNRFIFTDEVSRTVSVHSVAIIEALRNVYDAAHVADELQGGGR